MWATSTGVFLFGITAAFTFDYYSFIVARFLLAIVSWVVVGVSVCLFVFASLIPLQYFYIKP